MTSWLLLFAHVLSRSTRTQLSFLGAFGSYPALHFLGAQLVSAITFSGLLSPLTSVIRETLQERYDHAAVLVAVGFLCLAFKCYRRDLRQLLR